MILIYLFLYTLTEEDELSSGGTSERYMSFVDGRGWWDKEGSVIIWSVISSSTSSRSAAISNTDAGSSNVSESLWLKSEDSENGDSGNDLTRARVWLSSAGRSIMVEVDSGDNGTGG